MSEHPLQTHTERVRDQRRIEALEGQLRNACSRLAWAEQQLRDLTRAYGQALDALATARLWRIAAMLLVLAMALSILMKIVT